MKIFMLMITAKGDRGFHETGSYQKTRIVHMGFLMAESKDEALKRAQAMCRELEMRNTGTDDPTFSAETHFSEHGYHAEISGEGDLIRVGEFDD